MLVFFILQYTGIPACSILSSHYTAVPTPDMFKFGEFYKKETSKLSGPAPHSDLYCLVVFIIIFLLIFLVMNSLNQNIILKIKSLMVVTEHQQKLKFYLLFTDSFVNYCHSFSFQII